MVFGSCRYTVNEEENSEDYQKILNTLKKFNIYYIFINGGNGSVRAGLRLYRFLTDAGYEFRLIAVPKTVDNDISGIDHSPGFPSAARYEIVGISELAQDMSTYDTDLIMAVEVMGRNTGFLAAATSAATSTGYGPDLIYVPEVTFYEEQFLRDVSEILKKKGKCLAVVAEGEKTADGKYLFEKTEANHAENPQLNMGGITQYLKTLLGKHFTCKVRCIDMGLMQRCAAHNVSETDRKEAVLLGEAAVRAAVEGMSGRMISMRRISSHPYQTEIFPMKLEQAAEQDNELPLQYVNEKHNGIDESYLDYLLPLVGDLPRYASLQKKIANDTEI
jgi:6-phosphofructokinase 1